MTLQNAEYAYREYVPPLADGEQFLTHHIKARPEDISRYCFVPGSHLRGRRIAERLTDCRVVSATRGYYIYSGYADGVFLTVCSTGMGGPATAIAMEELGRLGADTFIRVGSAGTLQEHLGVGDIVISTGVCRLGGTAGRYLPQWFPAVPNFELTDDLRQAAAARNVPVHMGVTSAHDAFYGQRDPDERAMLRDAGLMAIEMEADAQFIVGQVRGWRCAAAFVLDGGQGRKIGQTSAPGMNIANHADHPGFVQGEADLIQISIDAMVRCAKRDAVR